MGFLSYLNELGLSNWNIESLLWKLIFPILFSATNDV